MKKLFIFLSLVVASFAASAQYYYLPYLNAGQNPKGLNTDIEEPFGALTGWTMIQATSATPVWSPVTSIPIPFNFNGSPVTSFKVSTSGVLTFATSTVAVPSSTSAALPSASIPDSSICVWGLAATGANDAILTKTFGTSPNRQFWIEFNTFSYPGIDPSSGWSYWGIVLEETTNDIYIVDMRTYNAGTTNEALSLGVQINNSTAVSVAGSPNIVSSTNGGSLDDPSDNSYYQFIPGALPAHDIELTSLSIPQYAVVPSNINITGTVTNFGSAPITSFVIKYQNGANTYPYTQTGVNIATGQTYNFTHGTPFSVSAATTYSLKVWVELTGDLNHINDTLNATTSGLSFLPVKNIVFEEATGTWCGWCPRGAVAMDSMAVIHPDRAMLIAVHNSDPMTVTAYDAGLAPYIPSGFPNGVVDRKYDDHDPTDFFGLYDQHINDVPPCDVSLTTSFNSVTRLLTINASGHFALDLNGDYRFNAVVTEDDVTGTTSAWDQHNYYSSTNQNLPLQGAGHNWQLSPDPIPAAQMYYNHVGRAILGGFDGLSGSLPTTITSNSTYQHTFTYTVPAGYNVNKLKVIAWVCNGTTHEIYNSGKVNSVVGINEETENLHHLLVYPNPSTGLINIRSTLNGAVVMKLNVMNSLGETVKIFDKLNIHNDGQLIDMSSFSNGLYFLQFTDENNKTFVSKILINR